MVRAMSRRGAAVEVPEVPVLRDGQHHQAAAVMGRRVLDEAGGEDAREFKEMVVEPMSDDHGRLGDLGDFLYMCTIISIAFIHRQPAMLTFGLLNF
ncbi:flavonoid 3',5'-hydroxylase 1-like [Hordeum vulgare]|nr:flavonoid 3',5'-hydroxylase 1-like [Hordeum vulgare]